MREIKFRAQKLDGSGWLYWNITDGLSTPKDYIDVTTLSQYIGLEDKNGKEIYELHEINNRYRVVYKQPSYVLQDIASGDIVDTYEWNKAEITGEYAPIPSDS